MITLHILYMSYFCTYHTHLLYMSYFCAYQTTLSVHVTFLYASHYAYCTCHISVRIRPRFLYMSHYCTYHIIVPFRIHSWTCITHTWTLDYGAQEHTQIIYLLFSNVGGKGCSSPVRNCSFKAIMLELFHIGWPTSLYTLSSTSRCCRLHVTYSCRTSYALSLWSSILMLHVCM